MSNKVSDNEGQIGKISKVNDRGELVLPIGHYTLINSNHNLKPKIAIYGIGSCIAPVIYDKKQKVVGISHILLPTYKNKIVVGYPHKYADHSLRLLLQDLINLGAVKENLMAIIVGGSRIFDLDENIVGIDNIRAIKEELKKFKITIIGEDKGGSEGRGIIFDTKDFSVYVKSTRENEYKRLYPKLQTGDLIDD